MSEPVTFRQFSSRGEAELVRELLAAHGIDAFISSDDCGATNPGLWFVRGVRLLVATEDLERAESALGEIEPLDDGS